MEAQEKRRLSPLQKAILIGVLCIATYVANYYLRHMLSVFTPALTDKVTGRFTEAQIGLLSSTYMIFYAGGQLINGFLGDILSPKKMIFTGLSVAGLMTLLFPYLSNQVLQLINFALLGFSLSMVRGPLMKTISENTEPKYARIICVFFSFASFAGPLIASLFAMLFPERAAFAIAGGLAIVIVTVSAFTLYFLEKHQYVSYKKQEIKKVSSILGVFKLENFAFYLTIACLVEIGAASVSFWIPKYLSNYLGFANDASNLIFSVISICRSFMPFVTLIIFTAIKERDVLMMRVSFAISSVLFLSMIFVGNSLFNIILLILALMALSSCSALLWSIYIPGLGKTGRTSSVNGVLDCSGYIAAALANMAFAMMSTVDWKYVLMIWASIGVIGVIATLLVRIKKQPDVGGGEA